MAGIDDLLNALREAGEGSEPKKEMTKSQVISALKEGCELINYKNNFHIGQIVTMKKGLENKKSARSGVMIVSKILDEPVYGDKESGSTYFREPLDMIIGQISDDGAYLEFHIDSRRVEPYEASNVLSIN